MTESTTAPRRKGRERQARWDKIKMRTVSTRLPEPVAAAFYAICAAQATTRYEALAQYIEACVAAGRVIDAEATAQKGAAHAAKKAKPKPKPKPKRKPA